MLIEFCRISFLLISEGMGVIVITSLESRFGAPNIMFGGAIRGGQGITEFFTIKKKKLRKQINREKKRITEKYKPVVVIC